MCRVVHVWGLVAWLCAGPADVAAAPQLQVRSRTAWAVQTQRDATGSLHVRARLVDSAGRGVAAAEVRWQSDASLGAPTADGGQCPAPWPATDDEGWTSWHCDAVRDKPTALDGTLHFDGNTAYGAAAAPIHLDPAKASPRLQLLQPLQRVWASGPGYVQRLQASDPQREDAPIAGLAVQIAVDGRQALVLRSDTRGEASIHLPWQALGGLGLHQFRAVTADETVNAAELTWSVELRTRAEVAVAVTVAEDATACSDGEAARRGDYCLWGRAVAWQPTGQQPLAGATVTIEADDRPIGTLLSDNDGRFAAILRQPALQPLAVRDRVTLGVRVAPAQPWVEEGRSPPQVLAVATTGTAFERALPPLLAGLAVVAGAWLWRRQRGRHVARRLQEQVQAGLPEAWVQWGPARAQPSHRLQGQVRHGEYEGQSVPAALTLTAVQGGDVVSIDAADGQFDIDGIAPGTWTLTVTCDQHMPLVQALQFPHDGRLLGCVLCPTSCRALVRDDLSAAIRRTTGQGIDWLGETPRQAAARWWRQLRRGQREARNSTRLAERAIYGRHTAAADVSTVRRALEDAERGGR